MTVLAAVNVEAVVIFAIVLSITLGITYWASKRMTGASTFYAAGRQITGFQNGLAISGDYLSAASFLGIAGLIYLYGFDGFLYSIGFLVAFLTVMFLLAERMRNAGKYTIADVLSFRLSQRPARSAAALGTLSVVAFYLIAQMVGAGVLIQALVGIDFSLAVILTGIFMLCYVIFGGMLATTWVQIIKAVLLMIGIIVMSVFVLERVGFNPIQLFNDAEANTTAESTFSLGAGHLPGVADRHGLARPRARARHGRAAAHPDAVLHRPGRQGRARLGRLGDVHHRLLLPADDVHRLRRARRHGRGRRGGGRHRRQPRGAEPRAELGGGEGTFGGDLFLAVIAGVAFATILAVVAGLVLQRVRRGGARHLVEHHPQGPGLREGGGRGGEDRGGVDRRDGDPHRRDRRGGPERVVHGRPRVRDRRERELPGAAARAHLAAVQHRPARCAAWCSASSRRSG